MPKSKRMNDGGSVERTYGDRNWQRSSTSNSSPWFTRTYEKLKTKYPTYNWGTAPTDKASFKTLMSGFKDWRKTQPGYNDGRNYSKGSGRKSSRDRDDDDDDGKPNTPTTPTPPTPPINPNPTGLFVTPKWSDVVSHYFPPKTMKAGGLVRGNGCAQRGKGKGTMR